MRIADLNWMQLEAYLERDDRIALPLGSTEQHAYLSLETDNILAERVSVEAAEPLGVPVLPVVAYGITPAFAAYPGSPTLRVATYVAVVRDLLDSLHRQGFRRILIANGHAGNTPGRATVSEWLDAHDDAAVLWHEIWDGRPDEIAAEIDADFDHASWSENFPWTRLEGVAVPDAEKPMLDEIAYRVAGPDQLRDLLGDGSFGGVYERPDEDMLRIWQAGVEEVRDLLENAWR